MKTITFLLLHLLALASTACSNADNPSVDGRQAVTELFDIVNPTAAYLMATSNSTFFDGSPAGIDDSHFLELRSSALSHGYRNDQPRVKTISFHTASGGVGQVMVATDVEFANPVLTKQVKLKPDAIGTFQLVNLVPGITYYYRVMLERETLASGTFKATGQLRMIKANSGWNIRDLGGWTGWGGRKVRYEWLYRGGSLGGQNVNHQTYVMDDADLLELERIGIRAQLDLRALPGQGAWPKDPKLNAYTLGYSPLPQAEFLNLAADFALYDACSCSAAVGSVAWVIKQVKAGNPVYFHCRTGADRTGLLAYTLLGLLGCEDTPGPSLQSSQIALDYELTSLGLDEQGTIELNTTGQHSNHYSNRYAHDIATMPYNYFRTLRSLQPAIPISLSNFQEQCYYYLNRYFSDNDVATAGRVCINKSDLDWFVNFMLGITDHDGNLTPGHTIKFEGPNWAVDHADNTLEQAYLLAANLQYCQLE